jgi:hypothetical protein
LDARSDLRNTAAPTRGMTLSSLETWTYWLTVTAIVLPIIGGIAAIFALAFSSRANTLRDSALAKFQADARAEIASANARATEIEPRRIASQQRTRMVDALQRAAIKGPIEMNGVLGDSEAAMFGFQLEAMLADTGWEIADSRFVAFPDEVVGLRLLTSDEKNPPPHAAVLTGIYEAAGLQPRREIAADVPVGRVRIIVGSKPK